MKIEIDKNNLLTIFNENIPAVKEYTYNVNGYIFSDYDKGIIVVHKKTWKIINLKNLGDNMSVCYIKARKELQIPFDSEEFIQGLCLFEGFDEITGKKYYFIPRVAEKEIAPINVKLEHLQIPAKIEKTEKGCIIQGDLQPQIHKKKYISFLFALTLLYGKINIRNNELIAIKIHIPLLGQFMKYEEIFDTMKKKFAEEGIFISVSKQKNNEGCIYQITCTDYEILKNIAEYNKDIEKIEKIPKYDQALEYKKSLLEFLTNNEEIPEEGKKEVIKKIQEGTMKLLTK